MILQCVSHFMPKNHVYLWHIIQIFIQIHFVDCLEDLLIFPMKTILFQELTVSTEYLKARRESFGEIYWYLSLSNLYWNAVTFVIKSPTMVVALLSSILMIRMDYVFCLRNLQTLSDILILTWIFMSREGVNLIQVYLNTSQSLGEENRRYFQIQYTLVIPLPFEPRYILVIRESDNISREKFTCTCKIHDFWKFGLWNFMVISQGGGTKKRQYN